MKVRQIFFHLILLTLCLSFESFSQGFDQEQRRADNINNGLRFMRVNVTKTNFQINEESDFLVDLETEATITIEVRNIDWYNIYARVEPNNYQNGIVFNGEPLIEAQKVIISGGAYTGGERTLTYSNLKLNLGRIDLKNPPEIFYFDIIIRGETSRVDNFTFRVPFQIDVKSIFSSSLGLGNSEVFLFDSIEKLLNKDSRVGFGTFKLLSNDPNKQYKLEAALLYGSYDPIRNAKISLGLNGSNFKELNEDYQEIWNGGAGNHRYSLDLRVIPGFDTDPGIYSPQIMYRLVPKD